MEEIAFKPSEKVVPQNNTYVTEKKEFTLSWSEWAAKNRTQISPAALVSGAGNSTLYVVPKNFDFFITSANMCGHSSAGAPSVDYTLLAVNNTSIVLGILSFDAALHETLSNSFAYPMPLKIVEGSAIIIQNTTVGMIASGTVTGWLEPKGN